MSKHATLIGLAILACSPIANAAYSNTSATVQSNSTFAGSNVYLSVNQSFYDGSDAIASPLPGSAAFTGGFSGEAKATSNSNGVSASSKASVVAVNGSPTSFNSGTANSASGFSDSVYQGGSGKVRFHLDYTLDVAGKNTNAGFSFNAQTFGSYSPNDDTYASFSDNIYMSGGSGKKTGSWTSDWLAFNADAWNYSGFYYNLNANSGVGRYNQLLGSSNADVNVNFSYELDLASGNTPPVPEPETYAMLLAGLGVVGMAARRRSQRA